MQRRIGEMVGSAASDLSATYRSSHQTQKIIWTIFAANLLFILTHVSTVLLANTVPEASWLANDALRLDRDRSVGEFFNYLQALVTVALLGRAFVTSRQGVYLAWALVFWFILLDDAMLVHERVGRALADGLDFPALAGLRPQDVGELLVWGVAAALSLPLLVWGFRSSTREAAGYGAVLTLIFGALVFFALGMDMVHILAGHWSRLADAAIAIVEDGGEMLALALACSYALLLDRRLSVRPEAVPSAPITGSRRPW